MDYYSNEIVDTADDGTNDYVVREARSKGMAPVVNREPANRQWSKDEAGDVSGTELRIFV